MQVASLRSNKNQAYGPEAIVWFQLRCYKPGRKITGFHRITVNLDQYSWSSLSLLYLCDTWTSRYRIFPYFILREL